jgi:hypothetical protein
MVLLDKIVSEEKRCTLNNDIVGVAGLWSLVWGNGCSRRLFEEMFGR